MTLFRLVYIDRLKIAEVHKKTEKLKLVITSDKRHGQRASDDYEDGNLGLFLGWFASILTMIGNGFVIFLVSSKRHLRTKTNAFIVSLAVADFLVGMHAFPSIFFLEVIGRRDQGLYIILLRLRWLFQDASVLSMCSLVLDRYLAVVRKALKYLTFMTSRRVIQLISFSLGISVAVILLQSFLLVKLNAYVLFSSFKVLVIVIFFIFPCTLIMFCFASMLRVIYRQNGAARALGKQVPSNNRREKSALIMMSIVVVLFLVLYCGVYVCCLLTFWTGHCSEYNKSIVIIVILNSAANPLAYAVFKGDIRKEIKRLIYRATFRQRKPLYCS